MAVKVVNHNTDPYDEKRDAQVWPTGTTWTEQASGTLDVLDADSAKVASYKDGNWTHVTTESE